MTPSPPIGDHRRTGPHQDHRDGPPGRHRNDPGHRRNKAPTNLVDLWVDDKYKGAYTLTGGKATFELGSRPGGDVPVLARYRPSATDQASQATAVWSVDTAPKPDPADCGVTILKANGQAWTCTFADDFNGTTLDRTKWTPQEIFGSGSTNWPATSTRPRTSRSQAAPFTSP